MSQLHLAVGHPETGVKIPSRKIMSDRSWTWLDLQARAWVELLQNSNST